MQAKPPALVALQSCRATLLLGQKSLGSAPQLHCSGSKARDNLHCWQYADRFGGMPHRSVFEWMRILPNRLKLCRMSPTNIHRPPHLPPHPTVYPSQQPRLLHMGSSPTHMSCSLFISYQTSQRMSKPRCDEWACVYFPCTQTPYQTHSLFDTAASHVKPYAF